MVIGQAFQIVMKALGQTVSPKACVVRRIEHVAEVTAQHTHFQGGVGDAARGILGWSVRDLAEKAAIGVNTVSRFENNGEAMHSTVQKMQTAFEAAGVIFISVGPYQGEGGAGVRLKGE